MYTARRHNICLLSRAKCQQRGLCSLAFGCRNKAALYKRKRRFVSGDYCKLANAAEKIKGNLKR